MKKVLKIILYILLALVVLVGAYVVYVMVAYYRVEDNLSLDVMGAADTTAATDTEYSVLTYNVGFGAYSADYSFFMDGGEHSWALSEEAVHTNINGAIDTIAKYSPDFMLLQEVDTDSTRSYHMDETVPFITAFNNYDYTFAQNYDSPYLFYPFNQPHGKSVAGLLTLSSCDIESAVRRSLPIEGGFMKFLDLDRCYSVQYLPVENGKTLCLYNLHLSAYSSDGSIATEQLKLLIEDMSAEYAAGNYVICGGDFNKDLKGDSGAVFGVSGENQSWAQPFPFELLPEDFTLQINTGDPMPTSRNADMPYTPGTSFVISLDGFITSANVTVSQVEVIDTGFAYSDHNPVRMVFTLNP